MEKLIYKPDWIEAKKRIEAWWHGEIIDRAAIMITAPKNSLGKEVAYSEGEFSQAELEDHFLNPEIVIPRMEQKIENTYWAGEAVPVNYPVVTRMVALLSNYLGCPLRFVNKYTTWSKPIIKDWEHVPELNFDPENKWWQKTKVMLETAASRAEEKYFIGLPDLNGPSEILSRLRSEEKLAIDTIEHKQEFKETLAKINYAWYRYFQACNGMIHQHIGGYLFWMGIWSDIQAIDLQSDFSIMISADSFKELILPSLRQQTEWVQRTVYHLDGPGATRHLDALLSLDKLTGIQWVPGAGAPPVSKWIPLLKEIQAAGKLVVVTVEKEEVKILLDQLNPEGLLMSTTCESPVEADELLSNVKKWT